MDTQRPETALVEPRAISKIALENVRVKFLGKPARSRSGRCQPPKEDGPRIGKLLNEIRAGHAAWWPSTISPGHGADSERVDETLQGREFRRPSSIDTSSGSGIRILRRWVLRWRMADIETEWYCFALNISGESWRY